ncbi:MAG TPA: DUF2314 domain-containing protein [Mucilaginibacter sp.]|nr:DUF2314 domain-containing protein [Mucilaginibacter sp.]
MKGILFILMIGYPVVAFCQRKVENDTVYQSVKLDKNDRIFLALKDSAQKYLPGFIKRLNSHGKDVDNYRFTIKSDFVENGTHEHMWSRVFEFDGTAFKGVFIDSPFEIHNIKIGDKVSIKSGDVEDWQVEDFKAKTHQGDFSGKYLKSKVRD